VLATMRAYVFDPGIADESLGIALLLLVAAGLVLAARAESRRLFLFAASILATLVLAVMMPSSRILVPSLACAALLGGVFAFTGSTLRMARALRVLLFVAALMQMSIAIFYFDTLSAFGVMSSQMSEERFLSRIAFYEEAKWADERLPAGSKTLVIGLNSLFWFEGAVRGGGNFDGPRMNAYLESGDAGALAARLREERFTHVAIFDRGLLANDALHRERATRLSPAAVANLSGVVNGFATAVAEEGNRHLFKLR
jgi:hypothetical protein